LPWAGGAENLIPSISSRAANDAKSVSLRGGAGAEGDIEALSGKRERFDAGADEVGDKRRAGAVEPPASRVLFRPSALLEFPPCPSFFFRNPFSLPITVGVAEAAACCAAFLFFLSIDMLWPGRICAKAHL